MYLDRAYSFDADFLLLTRVRCEELLSDGGSVSEHLPIEMLCDVWRIADYLRDNEAKNQVMNTLAAQQLTKEAAKKVIRDMPVDCGLHQWVLDVCAQVMGVEWYEGTRHFWLLSSAKDFVQKLITEGAPCTAARRIEGLERCEYHDHPDGEQVCN